MPSPRSLELFTLLNSQKWDEAEKYLEGHFNCCHVKDKDGQIPLHLALKLRSPLPLLSLLLKIYPVGVRIRLPSGLTAIHICVMYENGWEVFEEVVKAGERVGEEVLGQVVKVKGGGGMEGFSVGHFLAKFCTDTTFATKVVKKYHNHIHITDSTSKFPIAYASNASIKKILFLQNPDAEFLDEILAESIINDMKPSLLKGIGLKDKHLLSAWSSILSYKSPANRFLNLVDNLLKEFPNCVHNLTKTKGKDGRSPMEAASKSALSCLQKHLLFCGRYVLGDVVHRGVNNVLVEAKDLLAYGDYRAVFQAFLDMENEEKKVKKESSRKKEEKEPEEAGRVSPPPSPRAVNDEESPFLSMKKVHGVVNLLGFGIGNEVFEQLYSKWSTNADHSIDENSFIEFCKADLNKNKPRMVVMKFMRDEAKFHNEIVPRYECELESSYAMSLLKRFSVSGSGEDDIKFKKGLERLQSVLLNPEEFKCAFVMPKADQNLATIFRQERPTDSDTRKLMFEVGCCLRHFHNKNLIHGDLKMLNVVRFHDKLRLVDMDSSIILKGAGEKHFGAPGNFSTGLVPPEMVHTFRNADEIAAYESYFESFVSTDEGKEVYDEFLAPQKGNVNEEQSYCFRAYSPTPSSPAAPYALLEAGEGMDMWAFACMIYNFCANCQLFLADCDDNLVTGAIEQLAGWDDETKDKLILTNVTDPLAQDLLMKMLSKNPADRFLHMEAVLSHPYFGDVGAKEEEEARAKMASISAALAEKRRHAKVLMDGKTHTLKRLSIKHQYMLDCTVSSTVNGLFSCDYHIPKAFVILPTKTEGVTKWLDALDNVLKLLASEVDQAGRAMTPTDSSLPPAAPPPHVTSIRDELFKALENYGETRFNLVWVDEMTGEPKTSQDDLHINMSFLNALRFAPLMVISCKVLFRNFGFKGMARIFGLKDVGGIPFSFRIPFDPVDAVFDFDQFQNHVDSYGRLLDEKEEKEEKEEEEEEVAGEEKKEKNLEEKSDETKTTVLVTPVKKRAVSYAKKFHDIKPVLPPFTSPVKLSKNSHITHIADFDNFVVSRDHDFKLGGLVRAVGEGCCAWTNLEECQKMAEVADKEGVKEEFEKSLATAREMENLKDVRVQLREKETKLELAGMDIEQLTKANATLKATIERLEKEAREETENREQEHRDEKEKLAKEIEKSASNTGEVLVKKNAMLKNLEREITLNRQKFEEEIKRKEREAEEQIGTSTAEKAKVEREKIALEHVKMDLQRKLESTEQSHSELDDMHEALNDKQQEFKTKLRRKDNHIQMLKAKNEEMGKLEAELNGKLKTMQKRSKENEQLQSQLGKRENQLAMKTIEADKAMSVIDKKSAEINKLNREMRQLKSGGGEDVAIYEMREEMEKLENQNKGHVRELKQLRRLAKEQAKNPFVGAGPPSVEVEEEQEEAIKAASKKLLEMEGEVAKIRRIVKEGEKYRSWLKNFRKFGAEGKLGDLDDLELGLGDEEDEKEAEVEVLPHVSMPSPRSSMKKPRYSGGGVEVKKPQLQRRISFNETNMTEVATILDDGTVRLSEQKYSAISTPTRPASKKLLFTAERDGGDNSDSDNDAQEEKGGGGGVAAPSPPTNESIQVHKARVRALIFGGKGKNKR